MEGYKNLTTYILATVICDLNVEFIRRNIDPRSRTKDQMEQAGRSGKQCIAEGYTFQSRVLDSTLQSLQSYIHLLGVSDGSFKELTLDFEDFLRQRGLAIWDKDDPRVKKFRAFRAIWKSPNIPNTPNLPNNPEEAANMLLTFCQMETFLLKRQIAALKEKFVKEGGFRENLFLARRKALREASTNSSQSQAVSLGGKKRLEFKNSSIHK